MMKTIPLTQGQFAKVDEEDFDRINNFTWCASWDPKSGSFRATRNYWADGNKRTAYMHREVLMVKDTSVLVDHKNHDTLDNTKENLRRATRAQNNRNLKSHRKDSMVGVRGVSFDKRSNRYYASIRVDGKREHLGSFSTTLEASAAYAAANRRHFGEFGGSFLEVGHE